MSGNWKWKLIVYTNIWFKQQCHYSTKEHFIKLDFFSWISIRQTPSKCCFFFHFLLFSSFQMAKHWVKQKNKNKINEEEIELLLIHNSLFHLRVWNKSFTVALRQSFTLTSTVQAAVLQAYLTRVRSINNRKTKRKIKKSIYTIQKYTNRKLYHANCLSSACENKFTRYNC